MSPDSAPAAPSPSADEATRLVEPPVSAERQSAVDRARRQWVDRLIDPSRRNNLLYFRDLKAGSLDLSQASAEARAALLRSGTGEGEGVSLSSLVGEDVLPRATAAVREIQKRALANFEERGLDTMFVAAGLATWRAEDGGRPVASPVVLLPVEATSRGRSGAWSLGRAGEPRVNDVLLHALAAQHGVHVDAGALLADTLGDSEGEGEPLDFEPLFDRLASLAREAPGFAVERRWVLGNFSFQKMAIVRDLRELADALARHDLVAGIAGDAAARACARGDRQGVDPREFDRQLPDAEFLVLDADASQHAAIAATLAGRNGVVSGPPGTGKSQTIANLVAELAARGRTVLFVAEKRAALDVVLQRLTRAGLGHLCLDLHGADVSRRRVARQLGEALDLVRETAAPDTSALHAQFVDRRDRLNAHAAGLHVTRAPSGLSVHQLYGRLLRLPDGVAAETRFRGAALSALTPDVVEHALGALGEAASMAGLVTGDDPSPWTGARLVPGAVGGLLDRVRGLSSRTWPACLASLGQLCHEAGVAMPASIGDARRLLQTLAGIDALLVRYDAALFTDDLDRLTRDLAPAASALSRAWATLANGEFRRALRDVRARLAAGPRAGSTSSARALRDVQEARRLAAEWRALAPASPRPGRCPSLASAQVSIADTIAQVEAVATVVAANDLDQRPLDTVGGWLSALAADATTPARLLRVQELTAGLEASGVGPLLAEIRTRKPPPATWPDLLRHAWWTSCLEAVQQQEPAVAAFNGRYHDGVAEEFKALDRQRLEAAVARVRRAHAERVVEVRNARPDQSALVGREAQKRARHLPLRRLFAEAPDVLLALKPCWMASPLSVSQLLPGDRPYFDVVVFDEASQVLPEDAVTSLLRGQRAVIAGDARQLPPTTFFAAGPLEEDAGAEDDTEGTAGFESVLDVMSAFLDPPWSLDWHYRSRDEALIAFSNHHIYGDRLVTFPGPGLAESVSWVDASDFEAGPAFGRLPSDTSPDHDLGASREARCVVHLVLQHARTRPHESLGVIALGIHHADRIEMALDRERQRHPELDAFFASDRPERFFVKNLERVQGDERDAIVLTVGYGKDPSGRVPYRFGPLLMEGGERRLNVAVTRARRRMTVVSSFSHADLQADYPALGVRLLRAYLEFAAAGGRHLATTTPTGVPLNDFEQSVADAIGRRGVRVVPQLGASRYRIDLALTHPTRPGRYVLAVECDGASYHAAPTARDRDRLRQQHLEALGWRFHRIWSTDWFQRRGEEVERLLTAFEAAVRWADEQDARPAPVASTAPVAPDAEAEQGESSDPAGPRSGGAAAPAFKARGPRPPLTPGLSIDDYSRGELLALARWVGADRRLRTDEEWLAELMRELGFRRRGPRIVAALREAISAAGR